jgi:hypothetical protein
MKKNVVAGAPNLRSAPGGGWAVSLIKIAK